MRFLRYHFLAVVFLFPLTSFGQLVEEPGPIRKKSDAPSKAVTSSTSGSTAGKFRWQIGMQIRATGNVTGIQATMPVPMDWPEQDVKIVTQSKSRHVTSIRYRTISKQAKQMLVNISRIPAQDTAEVLVTFEIDKRDLLAPASTDGLVIPVKLSPELRKYLLPSPAIESRDRRIVKLGQEIVAGKEGAWEKVEAIFDWVRENIEYKFDRELKGALVALDRGIGDCEEMTSLFVALCRVNNIPARSVWIPSHTYPEFYLEDEKGKGRWFPCQAAGARAFGTMKEARPVLQKGDSFRVPGQRKPVRYIAETLRARNAQSDPQVKFIRRRIE